MYYASERGGRGQKKSRGYLHASPSLHRSHASQLLIPLHPARLRIRRLPTQLLSHLPHKWYVTTMAYLLYTKYNTTTVIDENFPHPMDALRPYRHFWTAVPVRDVVTLPFDLRTRPLGHPLASGRASLNPFRTAVPFWGQLGTDYSEFECLVPKTGLQF